MPIGITEEHDELARSVGGWCDRHCPSSVVRAALDAEVEEPPDFWGALAEQGWTGLHVGEARGGSGYSLEELVVVLEELGRRCVPGPFLPTALAAAVLDRAAGGPTAPTAPTAPAGGATGLLSALAAGDVVATVALTGSLDARDAGGGGLEVSGALSPVVSGHLASVLVARAGGRWVVLTGDEFRARELPSVDPTRRVAEVTVGGATVPAERVLTGLDDAAVGELTAVLTAAEAVGLAQWCVETAAEHARDRRQFGRPIGQFQGVKHRVATMLATTELARAAVWDAARAAGDPEVRGLTAAAAAALALDGATDAAKDAIQVLGGIGFTWEHDAHLYLRRAASVRALTGDTAAFRRAVAGFALDGVERRLAVDLPPEAEAYRDEVRRFVDEVRDLGPDEQRKRIAEAGYVQPAWPEPWGRGAGALEQLVVDEEFRASGIERVQITIGGWALPPVMLYGTERQQERWIPPTLRGEYTWCQLFSEPGAGSDLASLSTRAERVEGGWMVNGQKVWTSLAHEANWGFLLARTDPSAPKHDGISFFMVDMSTPGVEVRPLRELTGAPMFNEVFLTDVFIPDDCLVGAENDGWRATRTSLANERVFMGSGNTLTPVLGLLLDLARGSEQAGDPSILDAIGALVAESYALSVLGLRLTLSSLGGGGAGAAASVRKLLGGEHDQRVPELALRLVGADAARSDGPAALWVHQFLFNRALTIAGGTSEIQRNIIAERALGLPRDP